MRHSSDFQTAHVLRTRDLSPTVREIELAPKRGVVPWTVGSHLDVQVPIAGRIDRRSYSLIGLPRDSARDQVYVIAVKRVQPGRGGSRFMASLQAGDTLAIAAPANHFEPGREKGAWLLLAGGIGITPLLGIAQMLAQRGADLRMRYAAGSAQELVYADTLRAALGGRLRTCCSDAGERLDLDAEIAALPADAQAMVCGPLRLLEAMRSAWQRAGRDAKRLRFETFGSSGHHAAEPFWVELPRHRLRIEVPADRSLLDVLGEHGIATLADCRRGECGLCTVEVLSVQGRIDHRDVFMSEREQRENTKLCACVSRITGGGAVLDSAYRPD